MKFKMEGDFEGFKRRLGETAAEFKRQKKKLLKRLGLQLLSNAQLDYETKGRGGTGTDGITWKPLAESTIKAKNRKGNRQSGTAAKAAKKTLKESKKKGRPSNKTKAAKSFLAGAAGTQIGVDSGLQRASAAPGFVASDGKGGNVLEVEEEAVTVGYGRDYSEYFDEKRKLLPDELPPAWEQDLDKTQEEWADEILKNKLEGK